MKKSGLRLLSLLFTVLMFMIFGFVHSKDLSAASRKHSVESYLHDEINPIPKKKEWIHSPPQFPAQIIFCKSGYMNAHPFKLKEAAGQLASGLKEYTGLFEFADFPSMEIYLYNGDLYAETNQGKSILKKLKQKDSFEIVDYQGKLTFNRDSTNNIISVELDAQGFTSTGTKRKSTD